MGTGQYSQILGSIVIWGIFFVVLTPNTVPVRQQSAPSNDYLVPLLTCTLTDTIVCLDTVLIYCCLLNTIIVIIIQFWDFSWSLLCSIQVSVFVLGIGIARGQYYWVLDIGCLSWYRSNPTNLVNFVPGLERYKHCRDMCLSARVYVDSWFCRECWNKLSAARMPLHRNI